MNISFNRDLLIQDFKAKMSPSAISKVTYREIEAATGLGYGLLWKLANGREHEMSMNTFTSLCSWLGESPSKYFIIKP